MHNSPNISNLLLWIELCIPHFNLKSDNDIFSGYLYYSSINNINQLAS